MKTLSRLIFFLIFACFARPISAQDLTPSEWPNLKGYWKFQDFYLQNLPTVGNALLLNGNSQWVPGPTPKDTAVRITIGSSYKCTHQIPANGGGNLVNRYTLMFDFKVLSLKKWHTFFQTDTTNQNDGECFIRPLNGSGPGRIGTATTGYTPDSITPNKWYRLVISVSLGHHFRYYLNGKLILEGDTQDIDDRFALQPHFLLFADNNQEDDTIDVASVALFDTCLSTADIAKIGSIDPCQLNPMDLSLGRDTFICAQNTITKSLGYGNHTYRWSTGDTSANVVFSMKKMGSGNKTIWVKKTDLNGCFITDTVVIGFFNSPTVNLGKDSNICLGQSIKYIAGSAANNSYTWMILPSKTVLSKVNNLTIDISGEYMVIMQNQFGCSDMDTVQVTVHNNNFQPQVSSSTLSICEGDTAYVSALNTHHQYIWSNNNANKNLKITNTSSLSLKVKDVYGCESLPSDTLEIVMHLNPLTPNLLYIADTILCEGDSSLLFINGNYDAYIWNDGQGLSSRYVKKGGFYRLYVIDTFGCYSSNSNQIHITVNPLPAKPEIQIVSGKTDLCPGDSIVLQSKNTEANYEWNHSANTRQIKVGNTGVFSLKVKNVYLCSSEHSDSVTVNLHPRPLKPNILALGKDSLFCTTKAIAYKWFTGGQTGFKTDSAIKAEDKKTYAVQVGNGWCWSELSDSFYFEKTGLNNHIFQPFNLSVFPNPGKDLIQMMGIDFPETNFVVDILNIEGKSVYQTDCMGSELNNGKTIDVGKLAAGVYHIQLSSSSIICRVILVLE